MPSTTIAARRTHRRSALAPFRRGSPSMRTPTRSMSSTRAPAQRQRFGDQRERPATPPPLTVAGTSIPSKCQAATDEPSCQTNQETLAVDAATNTVYVVTFGPAEPVSVFNGATCNATDSSGCTQAPHSVTLGYGAVPIAARWAGRRYLTDTVYVSDSLEQLPRQLHRRHRLGDRRSHLQRSQHRPAAPTAPQTITVGPIVTSPDSVARRRGRPTLSTSPT